MKKPIAGLIIFLLLSAPVWAADIQSELVAAAKAQKTASEFAVTFGYLGLGFQVAGYTAAGIGVVAMWQTGAIEAAGLTAFGGMLLLAGSLSSYISWVSTLDALTAQAKINAAMMPQPAAEK